MIECEGAPRDVGLDQGRACRAAIQAALRARGLQPGAGSLRERFALAWRREVRGSEARLGRALARHFPHLDERTQGLARGASLADPGALALLAAADAAAWPFDDVALDADGRLVAPLREPAGPEALVVRRVQPDGGHRNLTVSAPGIAGGFAGVNERGLAGVALGLAPAGRDDDCAAPAWLLLDGCLERLDRVETALEWCERRPGGGHARLFFCDAHGAAGAIEIDAAGRRRVPVERGALEGPALRLDPRSGALELDRPDASREVHALGPA